METIGMEFGNKLQMDQLIQAVRRVGDIMENRHQSETEDKLDELLRRVAEQDRERSRGWDERERLRDESDRRQEERQSKKRPGD